MMWVTNNMSVQPVSYVVNHTISVSFATFGADLGVLGCFFHLIGSVRLVVERNYLFRIPLPLRPKKLTWGITGASGFVRIFSLQFQQIQPFVEE